MRDIHKVITFCLFCLTFSYLQSTVRQISASETNSPEILISPSVYTVPDVDVEFMINVSINNVTNLYGYDLMLWYDTTLLDYLNISLPKDHILTPSDPANLYTWQKIEHDYNSTHGLVWFMYSLVPPETSKNGSGVMATLTFKSASVGGPSPLSIYIPFEYLPFPDFEYPAKLSDPDAGFIPCVVMNGQITVVPEFTFFTMTIVLVMVLILVILTKRLKLF